MMPKRLNDDDREQWVMNDEALYNAYRRSRGSVRKFVRANRQELDRRIDARLNPQSKEERA